MRGNYSPTWVEITITAGTVAYFVLLYLLFTKFFPVISIWELKEDCKAPKMEETEPQAVGAILPSFDRGMEV